MKQVYYRNVNTQEVTTNHAKAVEWFATSSVELGHGTDENHVKYTCYWYKEEVRKLTNSGVG